MGAANFAGRRSTTSDFPGAISCAEAPLSSSIRAQIDARGSGDRIARPVREFELEEVRGEEFGRQLPDSRRVGLAIPDPEQRHGLFAHILDLHRECHLVAAGEGVRRLRHVGRLGVRRRGDRDHPATEPARFRPPVLALRAACCPNPGSGPRPARRRDRSSRPWPALRPRRSPSPTTPNDWLAARGGRPAGGCDRAAGRRRPRPRVADGIRAVASIDAGACATSREARRPGERTTIPRTEGCGSSDTSLCDLNHPSPDRPPKALYKSTIIDA